MRFVSVTQLAVLFEGVRGAALADFKSRCSTLENNVQVKGYDGLQVAYAKYVPKNTTIDLLAEGTNTTCALLMPPPIVPLNICRVSIRIPTSKSSEVYMEAWLPEEWNSRFMAVGTGGLAGCILYQELSYTVSRGFASVASNTGHNGSSAGAFLGQPEVFRDFTWRALYATTEVGKAVTKQVYGNPQKKSYYLGCSQGGRQGFKAAQRNPELFDGIIAGAPGLRLPGLFEHVTRWLNTFGTDANNLTVSLEKWSAIQNETIRQCDALDGATDGIIEDTRNCKPNLSSLQCGKSSSKPCLTTQELNTVASFFEPWSVNGTFIYPGITHNGYELVHAQTRINADFITFALEWHRFVSKQDLSWTLDRWTPADAAQALEQNFFNFNTWDGDLSAFKKRGGKILHWHGLMDQAIDSSVSDLYYNHVSSTMRASPKQLDDFYRYFRISGGAHCSGGPGANAIGQDSVLPSASEAAEDNILTSIMEWVEKGKAPDTVRGVKYVDDDPSKGVELQRKHCRYPKRNFYRGKGSGKDEKGWQCVD